jgi:cell division protein FtsL
MAKKQRNRSQIYLLIFLALLITGSGFLLFNEYGIINYMEIREQLDSLKTEIESIEKDNEQLRLELDSLRREIPAKIDEVAREKLGMKDSNEVVIKIEEFEKDQ